MDPNDNMRKRAPLPLQDWLWRLDRIQERLAQLLPERDLHVGFSLREPCGFDGLDLCSQELRTFPFGYAVHGTADQVRYSDESSSESLWLDLGGDPHKPLIVRCPAMKPMVVEWTTGPEGVPEAIAVDKEPQIYRDAEWCTWYYHKHRHPQPAVESHDESQQAELIGDVGEVQTAIVEAYSLAPGTCAQSLGDALSALRNWPMTLFCMAARRVHPCLHCYGTHAEWAVYQAGPAAPLYGSDFKDQTAYWIELTSDLRMATEYAFDALRHLAMQTGEPNPNRQGRSDEESAGVMSASSNKHNETPRESAVSNQENPYCCASWDTVVTTQEVRWIEAQFGLLADTLADLTTMVREMDRVAPREIALDRKVEVFVKPTVGVRELADEAELAEDARIDAMTGEGSPPDPGVTAWQSQETVGLFVRILASARKLRPKIEMVIGADQARTWYVDLHKTLTYRDHTATIPKAHGGFTLRHCLQWKGAEGSVEGLASRVEHWHRNLMLMVNEESPRGLADGNVAPKLRELKGPQETKVDAIQSVEQVILLVAELNREKDRYARSRETLLQMDIPAMQATKRLESDWQENIQPLIAEIEDRLRSLHGAIRAHWSGRWRWKTFLEMLAEGRDNCEKWKASGGPDVHIQELQAVSRALAGMKPAAERQEQPPAGPTSSGIEVSMTRAEIIRRIAEQRNIDFFRDRWGEFCQWVEQCGEQLARYQAEQTDGLYGIMEADSQACKQLEAARGCNDPKAIARWGKKCASLNAAYERAKSKREQQAQALETKGWTAWAEDGYGARLFLTWCLKLERRGTFYAPPDIVNPVLWLIGSNEARDVNAMGEVRGRDLPFLSSGRNPRDIKNNEERILCNIALLCPLHDCDLLPSEQRIYSFGTYPGRYFDCDSFYKGMFAELRGTRDQVIERTWHRVEGLLPKAKGAANQLNAVGQAGGNPNAQGLREWAGAERTTLAIVFTDIAGSTALRNRIGDERMNATLEAHFRQGRRLIGEHEGREIKTTGDGFLAVFHGTEKALDFAIAFHSDAGAQAIQIRVGIHVGEVTVKDAEQDVDGGTVHFASRVVGAIQGAEIWLSDQAKQNIEAYGAHRHSHLKWERHDGLALKDFPGTVLWSLAAPAGPISRVADQSPRRGAEDRHYQARNASVQPSERNKGDLKKTVAGTVAFLAQLWTCSGWLKPIRAFLHWLGL